MWNNQYGNILQKEFGFYFSSDNEAYPNVWIKSATDTSRDVSPRKTSPISDSRADNDVCVTCSRGSWITFHSLPSE